MSLVRRRPRLLSATLGGLYLLFALLTSDLSRVDPVTAAEATCPGDASAGRPGELHILQGNLWMLPARPLLLPYAFSADRVERLERFLGMVKSCRPQVVLLQEVFEAELVRLLADHLPDYRILASDRSDPTGTLNASGLVTLTRLPVAEHRFHEFAPLPRGAKTIESLARKGLLVVRVESPDFQGTLLNLHLYASRDSSEAGLAHAQLAEAMAVARAEESAGRTVLLAGDFNLPEVELAGLLPEGWTISEHGPTYDPGTNPYTVRGSNNTPGNHRDRDRSTGSRAIDFLLTGPAGNLRVRSTVLTRPLLSDHHFLHHAVQTPSTSGTPADDQ